MSSRRHSTARRNTLAALAAIVTGRAIAQGGARPLRLIVPNQTGSQADAVARALMPALGKALGTTVVVENIPGAGGVLGTTQLVRAAADGHTLALVSSNHVINPFIYKSLPFDPVKDVTPISVVGSVPVVLVVNNDVPAGSVKELIALLKAKPGAIDYGSAGNGTVLHLAAELFSSEAQVEIRHVPYKGTGALVTDLIGGHVKMAFLAVSAAAPQVRAGTLRALAVSTAERSPQLPQTPTLAESGLPGYVFDAWLAVLGPARMPAALADDLAAKLRGVLMLADIQETLRAQGVTVVGSTPTQFEPFLRSELAKHAAIVRKSGATAD